MCLVDGEASSSFMVPVSKNWYQDEGRASESLQVVFHICLFCCNFFVFLSIHSTILWKFEEDFNKIHLALHLGEIFPPKKKKTLLIRDFYPNRIPYFTMTNKRNDSAFKEICLYIADSQGRSTQFWTLKVISVPPTHYNSMFYVVCVSGGLFLQDAGMLPLHNSVRRTCFDGVLHVGSWALAYKRPNPHRSKRHMKQ